MTPKQIKELRLSLMLTQKEFGELFGVSRMTVYAWETGRYTPSFRVQRLMKEKVMEISKEH